MTKRQRRAAPARVTRRPASAPVQVDQVDARLLEAARDLAGGDMARVEIRSDGDVVVHNLPGWRRRRV